MYQEKIIDQFGNITFRDYTELEIKEVEDAIQKAEKRITELKEIEKRKQSALNKLIDLGLTEEETKAFLG